jgi:hypothetical protein
MHGKPVNRQREPDCDPLIVEFAAKWEKFYDFAD